METFRSTQKFLNDARVPFHTYGLPEERELKVEIIDFHANVSLDEISQALNHKGFIVNSGVPQFSPGWRVARNAFLTK